MQFIADIMKMMIHNGYITEGELYKLSEKEIIYKIKNCSNDRILSAFKKFEDSTSIRESENKVDDKYCISFESKTRYVNPLVKTNNGIARIDKVSEKANKLINEYLNFKEPKYAYLDFNL